MKTVRIGNWIRERIYSSAILSGPLVQTGCKQIAFICMKRQGKFDTMPNRWCDGKPVQNVFKITSEELLPILSNKPLNQFEILVNKRYINLEKYLKG